MNKWPDFLFTLAVRFICGIVLGCLACFMFSYRGILRAFSHNNTRVPLIWLALCGVIGGLIAVFTIPHWQTPWYKGIRSRNNDNDERE
jgi:H+/Cl- antiporter ClcA